MSATKSQPSRIPRPNRLKELRQERGMTQAEVGSLLGVSHMSVSHAESGRRGLSNATIEKYAELYGVPSFSIFLSDEDMGIDDDGA